MMNEKMADRLARLRERLRVLGVDAVLVPRGDAFSGEEVAACDERLHYISGFSGSAGLAIVSLEAAVLFSDGRYTLQMQAEVSPDWQCFTQAESDVMAWLGVHLRGGRLGYDPWLLTVGGCERFSRALEKADIEMVALASNPIDAIWQADATAPRPLRPSSLAWDYDEAFAGLSRSQKIGLVLEAMPSACDYLLVTAPDALAWLLNIRGGDLAHTPVILAFGLLHRSGVVTVFADGVRFKACDQAGLDFKPPQAESVGGETLIATLKTLEGGSVCYDAATCPSILQGVLKAVFGEDAVALESPIVAMKARKTASEQRAIRDAHSRDGVAVVRFLHWLESQGLESQGLESQGLESQGLEGEAGGGIREVDVAERLLHFRGLDAAFIAPSFATICGVGGNGAIVHYRAEAGCDSVLEGDTLCLIDSGGQYQDATTDITRTVAIGTPTPLMCEHFTIVLKAHIALAQAVFPKGTTGMQLDSLTRSVLWRYGLDYAHGTGHGVGCCLNVHEGPASLSKQGHRTIEAGMLLSNEPGYYIEGGYGIRIENLMLVEESSDHARGHAGGHAGAVGHAGYLRFDTVSLVPFDRRLIIKAMLTEEEVAWLDGYHGRIWESLSPLFEAAPVSSGLDILSWLRSATKPIGQI